MLSSAYLGLLQQTRAKVGISGEMFVNIRKGLRANNIKML